MSNLHRLLIVPVLGLLIAASANAAEPVVNFGQDRYTLSLWVKTTSKTGGPIFTVGSLNGKWQTGDKCIYMGEKGHVNIRAAGAGHSRGGPKINDGKWHQLVLPSFQTWRFYTDGKKSITHILDGVPDRGSPRSPILTGGGVVMKLGQGSDDFPNDTQRQFIGQIDDVRIYDRVLNEEEIAKLYEGQTKFGSTKLLAHWKLDKNGKDATSGGRDLRTIGKVKYSAGRDKGSAAEFSGAGALWLPLTDKAIGAKGKI
ncbi:MAG: LamG domain-containing protein, partial [Phycisphaerales bacterium]|nr:LamG domain-containing protein [Phycisphaerales bacterium]